MRRLLSSVLTSFTVASACALVLTAAPAVAQETLVPGSAIERELASGDAHVYTLDLDAGAFVLGAADQHTVDVVVTLRGPDGERIESFDAPARGPEPFRFTTEVPGVHTLTVTPFRGAEGRYTMRLTLAEPVATTPEGVLDQRFAAYGERTPGAAVAVVQDGEVVLARGYGMADLAHDAPITPETRFNIASVSKELTAFAIALLADRGELSLDDDVRTHLPELQIQQPVTVRQFIHHTSGFRDTFALLALSGRESGDLATQDLAMDLFARQRGLSFEPGTEFSYSNAGYVMLAEIVERVTGETFRDWMRDNVFVPLGMNRTFVADDHREVVRGRATAYEAEGGSYVEAVYPYTAVGSGNVVSTVGDLAKWMRNLGTGEVGGEAVARQIRERGVLAHGDTTDYAFGLFVERRPDGVREIGHSGAFAGARTNLAYYPDLDAGVIVLSNDGALNPVGMSDEIAQAFFADAFAGASGAAPSAAPASIAERTVAFEPEAFDAFAGRYEFSDSPGYTFTLRRDSTRYTIQILDGPQSQIWPISPTRFSTRTGVLELTFNGPPGSRAESMTVHQNGDTVASRIPDTSAPAVLADYAGRYVSDEVGAVFTARVADGALVLEHPRYEESVALEHSWGDRFRGDYPFYGVAFERDGSGAVSGFWVESTRAVGVRFERAD